MTGRDSIIPRNVVAPLRDWDDPWPAVWRLVGHGILAVLSVGFAWAAWTLALAVRFVPFVDLVVRDVLLAVATVASVVIAVRTVGRGTLETVGLRVDPAWIRNLILGSVLGLSLAVVALLTRVSLDRIAVVGLRQNQTPLSTSSALVVALFGVLALAIAEESYFRGFVVSTVTDHRSSPPTRRSVAVALAASAVGFAGYRSFTAGVSFGRPGAVYWLLEVATFGMVLAVAYLATGSVGLPAGINAGWAFGTRHLTDVAVMDSRGLSMVVTRPSLSVSNPASISSPEVAAVTIAAYGVVTLALLAWIRRIGGLAATRRPPAGRE